MASCEHVVTGLRNPQITEDVERRLLIRLGELFEDNAMGLHPGGLKVSLPPSLLFQNCLIAQSNLLKIVRFAKNNEQN